MVCISYPSLALISEKDAIKAILDGDITKLKNYLNQEGSNPNAVDDDGITLLMFASLECRPKMVQMLLEAGAILETKTPNELNALSLLGEEAEPFSRQKFRESLVVFLDNGANPYEEFPGIEGKTCLDFWDDERKVAILHELEGLRQIAGLKDAILSLKSQLDCMQKQNF